MNYTQANEKLQGRNLNSRKVANHTYLERRGNGDVIALRLHNTDIITFHSNGDVEFNSGGWRTVTTKARMNEFAEGGIRITQEKGIWYIGHGWNDDNKVVFEDGVTVHPDSTITGGSPVEKSTKLLKFRRTVRAFAKDYADAFIAGKVPAPSAGDCFGCQFRDAKGEARAFGSDHLNSHIEEKYFVPALLRNALDALGASIAMRQTVYAIWQNKPEHQFFQKDDEHFRAELVKYISRYMLKQLGQAA